MNPDRKKAIDRELRKERNKVRRRWLIVVGGFLLVLAIFTPIFSESEYGVVAGISAKEQGASAKLQMKVNLDSGKKTVILVESDPEHSPGRKVELSKMTSVAGMATYQFVRYVD